MTFSGVSHRADSPDAEGRESEPLALMTDLRQEWTAAPLNVSAASTGRAAPLPPTGRGTDALFLRFT
jgi:hypothetical protein